MKTKTAEDVLLELLTAVKAIRHETVGGVLPEVSREVSEDARRRLEDAIQDATEFLRTK